MKPYNDVYNYTRANRRRKQRFVDTLKIIAFVALTCFVVWDAGHCTDERCNPQIVGKL